MIFTLSLGTCLATLKIQLEKLLPLYNRSENSTSPTCKLIFFFHSSVSNNIIIFLLFLYERINQKKFFFLVSLPSVPFYHCNFNITELLLTFFYTTILKTPAVK